MKSLPHWLGIVAAVLLGFLFGRLSDHENQTYAEVRENPRPAAFQAGSERSIKVLEEMVEQLKSIDKRVERIEQVVTAPK